MFRLRDMMMEAGVRGDENAGLCFQFCLEGEESDQSQGMQAT
jgi:hypothetical protein